MLRLESETGWWLTTHTDHARLAAEFAEAWGNDKFRRPEPRDRVLRSIRSYEDGWTERDANPAVTRDGKPAAFTIDLVGDRRAFEEMDVRDFIAVRDQAARTLSADDPYAALLVAMHTHALLTECTERSEVPADSRAVLDDFLDQHNRYQDELRAQVQASDAIAPEHKEERRIQEHMRLLQACDLLSLLACVSFASPTNLVHPLPLNNGETAVVRVLPVHPREFRVHPWPFAEESLKVTFPARHLKGKLFISAAELQQAFQAAPVQQLSVTLTQ